MNNEQRIKAFNDQNSPFYIVDHEDGEFSLCFPLSYVPEKYEGFGQEAFNQYALQIGDPIMERGFYTHGDEYEWEEVFKKAFENDSNIGKIEFDCEASGFFCYTDDLSLLEDFGSRFRTICMDKEGFTDLVCVALKEAAIRQAEEDALKNTLRGFFMEWPDSDAEIRAPDGDIRITAEKGQQLVAGTVESVIVNDSAISAEDFQNQEITHYQQNLFSDNHFQIKTRWPEPSLQETENDESMNLC